MSNASNIKISKEWKVGIISIVIVLLFVWVGFFLAGRNLLTSENTYYAVFENTGGVNIASPVMVNGKKVGRVSTLDFVSDTDYRIKMGIGVKKKYKIPKGSVASVESMGLMSGSGVVLYLGNETEILPSGEWLEGQQKPDLLASLSPMKDMLESILISMDSVMGNINKIMGNQAVEDLSFTISSLKTSMENLSQLTDHANDILAANKGKVRGIVDNLNKVAGNMEKVSDTLANAELGATIASLQQTLFSLQHMMNKVEAGEGNLGQLLHNDTLYQNLENSSRQLELLLQDFREHPDRYIHLSLLH
ncbi:MAG: MlaD family protein, partial [Bacteroidales bacterium]|nr:MlaD family protein [Bacteroidales bacterium]